MFREPSQFERTDHANRVRVLAAEIPSKCLGIVVFPELNIN